jgi:hypothetical protein
LRTLSHSIHAIVRLQFLYVQKIQQSDVQVSKQKIGHLRGQNARALEHVVKMRLRNACMARQASFGQFAALDARVDMLYQPELKLLEIHGAGAN